MTNRIYFTSRSQNQSFSDNFLEPSGKIEDTPCAEIKKIQHCSGLIFGATSAYSFDVFSREEAIENQEGEQNFGGNVTFGSAFRWKRNIFWIFANFGQILSNVLVFGRKTYRILGRQRPLDVSRCRFRPMLRKEKKIVTHWKEPAVTF